MKKQLILLAFLFWGIYPVAKAQKFEVPQNYQLQDEADFEKYQPDVLKAIDWFQKTPFNEQRMERMEVSGFLMNWIEGCPYVVVETSEDINELGNANNDLLIMYFAGYARYVLQHPENGSKNNARLAGMKALLSKYEVDKAFIRDKKVEKLVKMDEQGELQSWLSEELD